MFSRLVACPLSPPTTLIKVDPTGCFAIAYTQFPNSHHPIKVCLLLVSPHYRSLAAESGIRFVHASSCRIMCSLTLLPTHTSQLFRAVDRNMGIRIFRFQSGSSLQSPAFLRVDPCCFSDCIIFFFQKGCGGCICMVLFFPQNPFFHFFGVAYFIAQSLFSNI